MTLIKSLEDLRRIRENLERQKKESRSEKTEIIIGIGTAGIAVGAQETLETILDIIKEENLDNIIVQRTGNIGLDSLEPLVQVILPDKEKVIYGKVNSTMARNIMKEHVIGNNIVKEYEIEN